MNQRRKHGSAFKIKVVFEALTERMTVAELAKKHQVHPTQINTWKQYFTEHATQIFDSGEKAVSAEQFDKERDRLYSKIGEQQIQLDFLKKKLV